MIERLTDQQLRAVALSFTERSIEAAAVNEAIVLRARVAKLEAALKAIKVGAVSGKPYVGVITDDGCWSVAIEDDPGGRMFRDWMKQRDAALSEAIS